MEKYTVRCNSCEFIGMEDNLEKVVEFKVEKNSIKEYLTLRDFNSKYNSFEDVFEYEITKGCPNCLTDDYLMDIEEAEMKEIETFLNYKGVEVYYLYKDLTSRDSVWEYHYTLDLSDTDGFDVRKLPTYNKELSIEDNLKIAIDKDLL